MTTYSKSKYSFGKNILGPIFFDFCRKLHIYLTSLRYDATCLFASRGGVRLLYLYQLYLKTQSLSRPLPLKKFFISRILAVKGTIYHSYEDAVRLLLREFPNSSIRYFLDCFCPELSIKIPKHLQNRQINSKIINDLIVGTYSWVTPIQEYLKKQEKLMAAYLGSLTEGRRNILLVDTGWTGTTQHLLMQGFPGYEWRGLYFGKWDTWKENPPHFYTINGIGLEGKHYIRKKPETAILHYHHIIEGPLEPKFKSVELLKRNVSGEITSSFPIDDGLIMPQGKEYHFRGICDYFSKPKNISEASKDVFIARKKLARKILYPSPADTNVMLVEPRSADFGKKNSISVLGETQIRNKSKLISRLHRIEKALWKQGEITVEFSLLYPIINFLYNNRAYVYAIYPFRKVYNLQRKIRPFISQ